MGTGAGVLDGVVIGTGAMEAVTAQSCVGWSNTAHFRSAIPGLHARLPQLRVATEKAFFFAAKHVRVTAANAMVRNQRPGREDKLSLSGTLLRRRSSKLPSIAYCAEKYTSRARPRPSGRCTVTCWRVAAWKKGPQESQSSWPGLASMPAPMHRHNITGSSHYLYHRFDGSD